MPTTVVTDATFATDVLQSPTPVLVDFWAEWCPPCKQIAPVLETLADKLDNVRIMKLNIEDSPEAPTTYGVRGIPTLMVFKNGEVVATKVGAQSQTDLETWLQSL